jgi:signal transduction histidine kinase
MRPQLRAQSESLWPAILAWPGTHFAAALVLGGLLAIYVGYRWTDDQVRALDKYKAEVRVQGLEASQAASAQMATLYHGLRTIARLPSVQTLDRSGSNLDRNAKRSIQELYNNLAANVAISEVYITGADFDPDALDPRTGKPQEPILMFDELIIGRGAEVSPPLRGGLDANAPEDSHAEEMETFEYRELRKQIAILRAKYPTAAQIKDLDYPALSSPPVVTCDNRYYSASAPNELDRTGIIYSVPFYGPDGRLRGIVSAIILIRNVHAALGPGRFTLTNAQTGYRSANDDAPATPLDPLFVVEVPLATRDLYAGWTVSATGDAKSFASRDDVAASWRMATQGAGLVIVLTLSLILAARTHGRFAATANTRHAQLDAMIRTRTRELNAKVNELEANKAALEQARADAESASEAKSQFLANMSHELRTPLNAILGFSDLIRLEIRGPLGAPAYKGYADDIHNSGSHLLSLINDILDLSKIEAGKFELHESVFRLHDAFEAAFKLLSLKASEAQVETINQIDPSLIVAGDERAFNQIAVNLTSNALKFTPSGGSVTVQSFADPAGVTLKFIDTGRGIRPEDLEAVFESFGQGRHDHAVKDRGTGLGLPIVRGLMRAHGGDARIDSLVGRGTTVILRIPAERLQMAVAAA